MRQTNCSKNGRWAEEGSDEKKLPLCSSRPRQASRFERNQSGQKTTITLNPLLTIAEFRDLLCVAASNITSGRCGDKSGKMSSLLDISRCWGQGAKAAEDGVDPKMQDFFSQTLIYNLNRLITQREPADAAAAGTVQPVEPLSHECLQHPADGAPDVLTQPLFQTNTTSSSSTTSTISIAICIISSSLTFILS